MVGTTLDRLTADLDYGQGVPDPRALAFAAELQERLADAQVLLFGSRATGDWRPGSDIDLAVIGGDPDVAEEVLAQVCAQEQPYADLPFAQMVHFAAAEFDQCRTSLPHIAGQIQKHGLTPAGEQLSPMAQDNPWPGIQDLLQPGRRYLEYALIALGTKRLEGATVFNAHCALERCIKAALAVTRIDFFTSVKSEDLHSLTKLAELLPAEQHDNLLAAAPMRHLWQLDAYQHTSRYSQDSQVRWPTLPIETLVASAQKACLVMADYTLGMMGKTPREVGYSEHVGDDALGGFGTLPLDHYAGDKLNERKMQRRLDADRIYNLHSLLGSVLTDSQLEHIATNWHKWGSPNNSIDRIKDVMVDHTAWHTLLVEPAEQEGDADRPLRDAPPKDGW
ncbi:MAG: nucleotidyltransferase domain-containing protein [Caldilineaceae bacterium]|nr:nucleotidyltransferase domain-containing protein [Caldilineaceae bacterium]